MLKDADILNNTYWVDENKNEVLYALSNRYYDGLIYRIPQLVEFGTYKSLLCETNGIGIGIAPNTENFADKLYEWYFNINQQVFEENCQKLLRGAINDERKMSKKLTAFLMEEQNDNFEWKQCCYSIIYARYPICVLNVLKNIVKSVGTILAVPKL